MRLRLLALACAVGIPAMTSAEPVPLQNVLFDPQTPQVMPVSQTVAPSASVRPAPRPALFAAPVRSVGVTRRITRLPWTTGVFQ
jgi:hypothetical protein